MLVFLLCLMSSHAIYIYVREDWLSLVYELLFVIGFAKPSQFAQELKSNLKPNVNDTLIHCPETSNTWLDSQVCFHRQLFADPVKSCWCITVPVEPLGSTNQIWWGAKLLPMFYYWLHYNYGPLVHCWSSLAYTLYYNHSLSQNTITIQMWCHIMLTGTYIACNNYNDLYNSLRLLLCNSCHLRIPCLFRSHLPIMWVLL